MDSRRITIEPITRLEGLGKIEIFLDGQGEVEAHLTYAGITPLPFSLGSPNIMGPFAYVPFMECYHGVGSLDHAVDGEVRVADRRFIFDGGRGYLENFLFPRVVAENTLRRGFTPPEED